MAGNDVMLNEYRALTDGAALQARPDGGALLLADADRVDFLQRMTTNNIAALRPGQSCVTVLTSPTAKIVHVFTVLQRTDDLLLLPARGETAALARALRGQIFFMDKVRVEERSAAYTRMRLMGPGASAALASALASADWAAEGMEDGDWREQDGVLVVLQRQYDVPGYELLVEAGREAEVRDRLLAAGVTPLGSDDAYHARRVELGRPLPGAELLGEYNPLEVGLAWACAENKGCYTGQEIIARQITYDKVTRALVGITAAPGAELPSPGAPLHFDGRAAGVVTSTAYSPARNAPLGLAIVKRPLDAPGTVLQAGEGAVVVGV